MIYRKKDEGLAGPHIYNTQKDDRNGENNFSSRDSRFRLIKILSRRKEPLERNWQGGNNYSFDSPDIGRHIRSGGNYGIFCPNGDCCFVDADTKEIQGILDEKLPTFWYSTGREGHRQYVYLVLDPPIKNVPLKDGAYIKGKNGYALGPGSIHPNGNVYGLEKSLVPIRKANKQELLDLLKPFLIRSQEPKREKQVPCRKSVAWISLADIIDLSHFRRSGSKYQGPHPIHGSDTGVNLSVDLGKNVWHCFRHDSGGSVLDWIAVSERIIDCSDALPGVLRKEKFWQVLEVAHSKYGLSKETAVRVIKGE